MYEYYLYAAEPDWLKNRQFNLTPKVSFNVLMQLRCELSHVLL